MTPQVHPVPVDPSQLMRLWSNPARAIMALFVFGNAVYTFTTLDKVERAIPVVAAMLVVNAAATVLVIDRPDPFPTHLSLLVVAAVIASNVLIWSQLSPEVVPGRVVWHLGANTWILFFLALRRRSGMAWLGFLGMALVTAAWAQLHGESPIGEVLSLDTQAAILLVGTLFGRNLRRTALAINDLEAAALESSVEQAEIATAAQIRHQRVAELRTAVAPLLEQLAQGHTPTTDGERRTYSVAEAALRDGVRARALLTPAIVEAVAGARERGVEVQLLDDRGHLMADGTAMARIEAAVTDALAKAKERIIIRLLPVGRPVAVSVVSFTNDEALRTELDAEGLPIVARPEGLEPPTF